MRRWSSLLAGFVLAACSQESRFVPRAPGAGELHFAIAVDRETGTRVRVLSSRPLDEGGALRTELDGAHEVALVRVPVSSLAGAHCRVARDRVQAVQLAERMLTCVDPAEIAPAGGTLAQPLATVPGLVIDGEDGVLSDADAGRILAGLVLDVPLDPPRGLESSLQPFATDAFAFSGTQEICGIAIPVATDSGHQRILDVEWVDDDRVLAVARRAIYLLRRGADFTDAPEERYCRANADRDVGVDDFTFVDVALLPPGPGGGVRLLALATFERPFAGSAIVELAHGNRGFRHVRTATIVATPLEALATDVSGAALAVGLQGLVITATSARGTWISRSVAVRNNLTEAAAAHDGPGSFIVAGSAPSVIRVRHVDGDLVTVQEALDVNIDPKVTSIAANVAGGVAWASVLTGVRRFSPEQGWGPVELELPIEAEDCAPVRTCGRAFGAVDPSRLTAYGSAIAYAVDACGGLIIADDDLRCARVGVVPLPAGLDIEVRDMAARGDLLVLSAADGYLLELRPD